MTITTKTIVSFRIPDETLEAWEFEKQHPDWVKKETSGWFMYKKEQTFFADKGR